MENFQELFSCSRVQQIQAVVNELAAALGLLVAGFWLGSESPNFHEHAAGHWIMAIPVLFVALVIVRLPEARTMPRRMARLFLAIVVLALAASQILEGIGAFASTG